MAVARAPTVWGDRPLCVSWPGGLFMCVGMGVGRGRRRLATLGPLTVPILESRDVPLAE